MNNRFLSLIIIAGSLFSASMMWLAYQRYSTPKRTTASVSSTCSITETDIEIKDVYMRGELERGETVQALMNWYQCHSPKRGDYVLYRYSMNAAPVVKRLVALPGDKVELRVDKQMNAWNLLINNELVKANGKPYFFGIAIVVPPIGLHAKSHNGKLGERSVLILSSFPPGDLDSGTVGAVDLSDLVARVQATSLRK